MDCGALVLFFMELFLSDIGKDNLVPKVMEMVTGGEVNVTILLVLVSN